MKTLVNLNNTAVSAVFYWDAHGKEIPWEYNGEMNYVKYFKNAKLVSEIRSIFGTEFEVWKLLCDGKEIDLGDITGYNVKDNCIRLKCCVGAG